MKQNMDDGDSFLDELLKNTRTRTRTRTCNPPGLDDAAHTHTCNHTHTQAIVSSEAEEDKSSLKRRRSSGSREAVRKYREKKKAHTAYLEEEVKKLRVLTQQLVRKLQGQVILEAEILRLTSLLVDFKGKIDNEKILASWEGNCRPKIIYCHANAHDVVSAEGQIFDAVEALVSSSSQAELPE